MEPSQLEGPERPGLGALRWGCLNQAERLVVAALVEAAAEEFGNRARQDVTLALRKPEVGGPVLDEANNRRVAELLEQRAKGLEAEAERHLKAPALFRSAHYLAGYLRSLLDRLVRGVGESDPNASGRIVELMLLEPPSGAEPDLLAQRLLSGARARLDALGLGPSLDPILWANAGEAARRFLSRGNAPEEARDFDIDEEPFSDDAFDIDVSSAGDDFEIVDERHERRELACQVFDATVRALEVGGSWNDFFAALLEGKVRGCKGARESPRVAARAATTAHVLVLSIRGHLERMSGWPWEAIQPGLKALIDRYPALKRRSSLKEFVRQEIHNRRAESEALGG